MMRKKGKGLPSSRVRQPMPQKRYFITIPQLAPDRYACPLARQSPLCTYGPQEMKALSTIREHLVTKHGIDVDETEMRKGKLPEVPATPAVIAPSNQHQPGHPANAVNMNGGIGGADHGPQGAAHDGVVPNYPDQGWTSTIRLMKNLTIMFMLHILVLIMMSWAAGRVCASLEAGCSEDPESFTQRALPGLLTWGLLDVSLFFLEVIRR